MLHQPMNYSLEPFNVSTSRRVDVDFKSASIELLKELANARDNLAFYLLPIIKKDLIIDRAIKAESNLLVFYNHLRSPLPLLPYTK